MEPEDILSGPRKFIRGEEQSETPPTIPGKKKGEMVGRLVSPQEDLSEIREVIMSLLTSSCASTEPFVLPTVETTQNPVTRIFEPFHIPKKNIPAYYSPTPKDLRAIIEITRNKNEFKEKRDALLTLFQVTIKEAWLKQTDPIKKLADVIQAVENHYEGLCMMLDEKQAAYEKDVLDQLRALPHAIKLEKVEDRCQRDEILSVLKQKLEELESEDGDPEEIEALEEAMETFQSMREEYVKASDIDKKLPEDIKKELTLYVRSTDVLYRNIPFVDLIEKLRGFAGLVPEEVVSYAFKTGVENFRELLAGKLAESMGLSKYLLHKYEATFRRALLGKILHPTGIASQWLQDASNIPPEDLNAYMVEVQNLAIARHRGEDTTEIEKKKDALAGKILKGPESQTISQESLEYNVLLDLLFCSYDSHINQYKITDGDAINFDFSRFLAPHEAFKRGEHVFLTLRSFLLDHPGTTEPISEETKKLILSWDVKKMISEWKKKEIIGDKKVFKTAAKTMKKGSSEERNKQQVSCYRKIHPQAVERLQERILKIQQYIAKSKQPTLQGAFAAMYPDVVPFMKVLQRMCINPSGMIALKGPMEQRSLQSIIQEAKDKKLASAEEVKEMGKAIKRLKKKASSTYEAVTAIYVGTLL